MLSRGHKGQFWQCCPIPRGLGFAACRDVRSYGRETTLLRSQVSLFQLWTRFRKLRSTICRTVTAQSRKTFLLCFSKWMFWTTTCFVFQTAFYVFAIRNVKLRLLFVVDPVTQLPTVFHRLALRRLCPWRICDASSDARARAFLSYSRWRNASFRRNPTKLDDGFTRKRSGQHWRLSAVAQVTWRLRRMNQVERMCDHLHR